MGYETVDLDSPWRETRASVAKEHRSAVGQGVWWGGLDEEELSSFDSSMN